VRSGFWLRDVIDPLVLVMSGCWSGGLRRKEGEGWIVL